MDDEVFAQFRGSIVLPSGWQIAPLAQLSENIVDCPHTTPKWTDKGEICIRTNQLRPRALDLSEPRYVSPEAYIERIERLEPKADDILYSREGGILGIACRVPHGIRLCLGQRRRTQPPSCRPGRASQYSWPIPYLSYEFFRQQPRVRRKLSSPTNGHKPCKAPRRPRQGSRQDVCDALERSLP